MPEGRTPDAGPNLAEALRRYWGYHEFRPKQESVIRSLLAAHDTCVVMPTGGGKSLCYQLPAVISGKTAVVVSPLIALMQDQAAQLAQMGIPAAAINSMQSSAERRQVMEKAARGEYRLLYLSPERLAAGNTFEWLSRVPVGFFAVDEAHCISEWGHEFRPDYRQLSRLRTSFPALPIAAFTASATQQVRHDILKQLQMRQPDCYIASFHRQNLRYVVHECEARTQMELLSRALRHYAGESVIVYSPTIRRVEETVEYLEESGIAAIPYHAKMESPMRRQNQERWMSDEVRVLVGTIAFGLGINKPAVRAVIHLSLPKSIEQYYQEAGRAGRDGRPADCVLLWQKKDAGLLAHFIEQLSDSKEHERAWQRYHIIRAFVDSTRCRHRQICLHFGETPKWSSCGACDVCGYEMGWLRAPVAVPKSKRCGKRPATERAAATAAAASITFTRGPRPGSRPENELPLSASIAAASTPGSGWWGSAGKRENSVAGGGLAPGIDPELREYLREWRRVTSKKLSIAAFIIMHDTSLDHLCQVGPRSLPELRKVSGFGERKTEMYGPDILEALERFRNGARVAIEPFLDESDD